MTFRSFNVYVFSPFKTKKTRIYICKSFQIILPFIDILVFLYGFFSNLNSYIRSCNVSIAIQTPQVNFSMVFTWAEQTKFTFTGCLWVFRAHKIHPLIKMHEYGYKNIPEFSSSDEENRLEDLQIVKWSILKVSFFQTAPLLQYWGASSWEISFSWSLHKGEKTTFFCL